MSAMNNLPELPRGALTALMTGLVVENLSFHVAVGLMISSPFANHLPGGRLEEGVHVRMYQSREHSFFSRTSRFRGHEGQEASSPAFFRELERDCQLIGF